MAKAKRIFMAVPFKDGRQIARTQGSTSSTPVTRREPLSPHREAARPRKRLPVNEKGLPLNGKGCWKTAENVAGRQGWRTGSNRCQASIPGVLPGTSPNGSAGGQEGRVGSSACIEKPDSKGWKHAHCNRAADPPPRRPAYTLGGQPSGGTMKPKTAEHQRVAESGPERMRNWRLWGPYVSERQWGTV